jgi:diaminopimelate epimerase
MIAGRPGAGRGVGGAGPAARAGMAENGLMRFAKGHGTGNDFVLLPDPDGEIALTPALVRAVCDRRFGIGGDGVLRIIRTAKHPEAARYAADAEWFMDYQNADGSVAAMCGNGARVFARYLREAGLVGTDSFTVATRSGLLGARISTAEITVDMPLPVPGPPARATIAGREYPGTACSAGNPNLVCPVDDLSTVDLSAPPVLDPAVFPHGANVELVVAGAPVPGSDLSVRMRVYERGSAETLSCGSGACAVAAVALRDAGLAAGRVAVEVPGGRLGVAIGGNACQLSGAAVIVAHGELRAAV